MNIFYIIVLSLIFYFTLVIPFSVAIFIRMDKWLSMSEPDWRFIKVQRWYATIFYYVGGCRDEITMKVLGKYKDEG